MMSAFNSLTFLLKIAKGKFLKSFAPLSVIFNVTNRCNCRCKHCYATYYNRESRNEIGTQTALNLLRDLKKNGCRRVSFSGGEPLLRKDLFMLLNISKEIGLSVTVNSNGILVPGNLKGLRCVDALAVSLDGRPENHDRVRGIGTAEKALKGINKAVDFGINVHVNMVLNQYNIKDVDYIINLANRIGFKAEFAINIDKLSPGNERSLKASNHEIQKALLHIIKRKDEGKPILFSAKSYKSVLNCWKDFGVDGVIDGNPPEGMPECPAGKFFAMIDADGTLWACPHLMGKSSCKNVVKDGFASAWEMARQHDCKACFQVYHHEFALLMNLDPEVLWNYSKHVLGLG